MEHLVFTGSEDYPYKGILDHVANRCFAQGTNAWTDVDHTWYCSFNHTDSQFYARSRRYRGIPAHSPHLPRRMLHSAL